MLFKMENNAMESTVHPDKEIPHGLPREAVALASLGTLELSAKSFCFDLPQVFDVVSIENGALSIKE